MATNQPQILADHHPELFHYTTRAGLEGILKSNSLWATYFRDLNDANEIHELRSPLVLQCADKLLQVVGEFRSKGLRQSQTVSKLGGNAAAALYLARRWVNALYRTTFDAEEPNGLCCITSFCSHSRDQQYESQNGLLSQWRGYAGNDGVCLVFDTRKLLALIEREHSSFFMLHTQLHEAHYPRDGALSIAVFDELISLSTDVIRASLDQDSDLSVEATFVPFVTCATSFKHRGFFEEREVRLVAMAATKVADQKIRHLSGYRKEPVKKPFRTIRNGRERTHISLFDDSAASLPVVRIIIGPSPTQATLLKELRERFGDRIPIVASETPFIG